MAELTQSRAKAYYNYDPESGTFFFKERPRSDFDRKELYTAHLNRVGKVAGGSNADGYAKILIDGKYYYGHKLAWLIMTGETVVFPYFEIDHINGDRTDNRFSNLRKVTKSENQRNSSMRVNNTSGVHGVNWKPKYNSTPGDGRWVARIWNGPRHVYLGGFKEKREAEIARKAAERVLGFTGTDRKPNEFAARRTLKAREKRMVAPKAKQMGVGE